MMRQARISTDKITRRADRIEQLDLEDGADAAIPAPTSPGPLL